MLCRFELVSDRKTKKTSVAYFFAASSAGREIFCKTKVRNFTVLEILSKFLAVMTRSDDG